VIEARSFGNLGVFVDGEGKDFYAAKGHADSSFWTSGLYALGYDVARDSVRPREAPVDVSLIPADTLRSVEDLFRDAAKWEVTDTRVIVRRARLALDVKWRPAIPWVAAHKLTSLDGLERRAIVELFKAHADSAAPCLFAALESGNRALRRNVIGILAEMKYRAAGPALRDRLADTAFVRLRPALLTALGEIGDTTSVPTLVASSTSPVERERIAATISLGKLGDARGHAALLTRLEDSLYTVRSAAIVALGGQKSDVRDVLEPASLSTASSVDRLEAMQFVIARLAAKWKTTADSSAVLSLSPLVVRGLQHPLPRVRGAALLAAASYWRPAEVQRLIDKFHVSPDPVLRARVRQAELLTR
jgi:HEAT repeat protein